MPRKIASNARTRADMFDIGYHSCIGALRRELHNVLRDVPAHDEGWRTKEGRSMPDVEDQTPGFDEGWRTAITLTLEFLDTLDHRCRE